MQQACGEWGTSESAKQSLGSLGGVGIVSVLFCKTAVSSSYHAPGSLSPVIVGI